MSLYDMFGSQTTQSNPDDFGYVPWGNYETYFPKPATDQGSYIDGNWVNGQYVDGQWQQAGDPYKWEQDRQNYYNDRFFNKNPFKLGDPGTTTLYFGNNPDFFNNQNPFKVSTNPFEGGRAFAAADPTAAGFNMPTEGWDKFWNQAFGSTIQEEYVPTCFSGAQGKDTTNFDYMTGINPFKQNWGFDQATLMEKPDSGPFILEALRNMAPALGIMAAPLMGAGLGSLFGTSAGGLGAAGLGGIDSALLGGAAGSAGAWAPSMAGTIFNTAMPSAAAAMEASTLAGMGLSAAEMGSLGLTPAFAQAGINSTMADMFPTGGDPAFNTPMTGGGAGSVPAEGASMFDEIFGPPLDLANPGINPLSEFMGPGIELANPGINPLPEFMGPPADLAGSSGFGLKDIWNWMNSPLAQGGKSALQLATKLGSAAVGDQSAKKANQQLQQYLQQQQAAADPFGPQRPYYQDELKKSYINPLDIYNRPEYQGLKSIFEEGIRRRDAAKGRRVANEFPRAIELQDHFMKFLGDYRQGLQNPAGTTISPNNVGQLGQLFQSGLNNRYNALGNYSNALGSIFDPYANQKQQMTDKLTAFLNSLG